MREQQLPKECVFCKMTKTLQMDHLIPVSRAGQDQELEGYTAYARTVKYGRIPGVW